MENNGEHEEYLDFSNYSEDKHSKPPQEIITGLNMLNFHTVLLQTLHSKPPQE